MRARLAAVTHSNRVAHTHTHFWLRAQLSKHIAECAGLRLCAATRLRQQSSATACSQGCTFRLAATACARALACRSLTRVFPRVPCPAEPHQRLPSAAAVTIAYRRQRQHQCRGEPGQAVEDAGAPSQCERRAGRPQGRERHRALPVHHGLEHVAPAGTQPAGSGCTAATATTRQQRQGATASDSHAWAVGGDWVQHGGVPKHAAAVHIRGEAQPHHHRGVAAPGLAQRRRRGQRGGFPAFHPDRRGDRARDGQ